MGRTDAVRFVNECAAAWRSLGATVTFEPGWETRGNGAAANYEGAIVHHTASASSPLRQFPTRNVLLNGRPGLAGPLCNVAGPWCTDDSPLLHVIAAHPGNHAGASGGRSMGPLPVTAGFNARTLGLEIDYSGIAPMAPGQYRAALIFAKGVVTVLGRSIEYVRAHAETSVTGKYDPGYAPGKTIDMAAFRREAAAYQEDDMPTAREVADALLDTPIQRQGGKTGTTTPRAIFQWLDANLGAIPDAVLDRSFPRQGGPTGTTTLRQMVAWMDSNLTGLGAKVATSTATQDPAAIAAAIHDALGDELASDVASRLTVTAQP